MTIIATPFVQMSPVSLYVGCVITTFLGEHL